MNISNQFADLLAQEITLQGHESLATYHEERNAFTHKLNQFIHQTNFSCLSTLQLLQLCDLVGIYRPMAPHSFLIRCSQLIHPVGVDKTN